MKKREEVSVNLLLQSQIFTLQALINVLERKGIITTDELLDELHEIKLLSLQGTEKN